MQEMFCNSVSIVIFCTDIILQEPADSTMVDPTNTMCMKMLLLLFFFVAIFVVPALGWTDDDGDFSTTETMTAFAIVAIMYPLWIEVLFDNNNPPKRLGPPNIRRTRPLMKDIFAKYSKPFLRRTYRMSEESFWRLLDIVEPHMPKAKKRGRGKTPNGDITPALRLSMSLRYFAGGDADDIGVIHGVHRNEVLESVRRIINAVHASPTLAIKFPTDYAEQQRVVDGFKEKSSIGVWNCVGAIDGILIWTHKPRWIELLALGYGPKKFFCGRKKKYGVNMQAICDAHGRFIDFEIKHPGATADYLAFTTSTIYHKIQGTRAGTANHQPPFIKPGLALFGDNAYVNAEFMCVPFKAVTEGAKDAYNFFQSQTRINIECAFGMLVQRWGILRKPMPINFSIQKMNALVGCLCKLHNYCISEKEMPPQPTAAQVASIVTGGGFSLQTFDAGREDYLYDSRTDRVDALLDGGQHFEGLRGRALATRRGEGVRMSDLPSQLLLEYVDENGYCRPTPRGRRK